MPSLGKKGPAIIALVVLLASGCAASIGNRYADGKSKVEPVGYRIETVKLEAGGWGLLKYRSDTGEAWYSTGDVWVPIVDQEPIPKSRYVFKPAPNGGRGWSVIRLDTQTGRTWITRNSVWVEVEDPSGAGS
jgi:hypothetical protein